ncbi:MAG: hypothetical protein PVG65_03840 [Candidatus Thorarchaeota archaeon]|jgi:hypothetical protein
MIMQTAMYETLPTVLTIAFGLILSSYLFRVYFNQEVRLSSDLPFIFGITFAGLGAIMVLQLLFRTGVLEETLELFRLRAISIGLMALPMLWALLNIWANSYQHRHPHIMVTVIGYWLLSSFLGPSIISIMMLLLPVMLILGSGLVLTFIVTWKTGRLQEIRSGIAAIGLSLMLLSQVLRVVVEIAVFVDLVIAASMFIITFALVNPLKLEEETLMDSPYQAPCSDSTIESTIL